MLTVEKDTNAEEICIHGTPEDLREFAKKLWQIAEKSESSGQSHAQLTTSGPAEPELTAELQGDASKYSIVHKLSVYGWQK